MNGRINHDVLTALVTYNAYANGLVLDTVARLTGQELAQDCSPSHGSVHGLLAHMLECEAFFLTQCQGRPLALESSDVSTLSDIRRTWRVLEQEQVEFIQSLDEGGLAREVHLHIREQALSFQCGSCCCRRWSIRSIIAASSRS